jgi:folate-binding protein YgfZ
VNQARELEWLTQSVGIIALGDRAIISVGGDDARDWIQGQVTNQVEGVPTGGSVYAFVLTLKGRTLADVYVLFGDDAIWLDVPEAQVEALLARLDRYIIMEDVDLEHRPDLGLLAAVGPRAGEVGEGGWTADRLGVGGRQWLVSMEALASERDRLLARSRELGGGLVGEEAWRHAHVLLGRPLFGVDFGDWTYPQETGLTELAVSFKKGCYIGQETVVMLENRGKAPKLLWRWAIEGRDPPAAKTPIVHGETVVGEITSAVTEGDGSLALGFLKRGHEGEGPEGFSVAGRAARRLAPVTSGPRMQVAST